MGKYTSNHSWMNQAPDMAWTNHPSARMFTENLLVIADVGDDAMDWSVLALRISSDTAQFSIKTHAPVWEMYPVSTASHPPLLGSWRDLL